MGLRNKNMFVHYPKIYRLGKEENEGLLDHEVVVQEKIDGANTSIWLEDGVLKMGSRTRILGEESFNGFCEYVRSNEPIMKLLADHPEIRAIAGMYDIPTPQIFIRGKFTEDQIKEYVGKTNLGDKGEGVVIKCVGFVNKFGDHSYAKIVSEKFKENNALVFGGNNKFSDVYNEMRVVNKYCTLSRVQKIMNKIQPEVNKRLDFEHTPRIANTCYHDMLTEEIWEIQSVVAKVDFKILKRLCTKKFIQIYHDILNDDLSVADQEGQS
jgi:hypothetical protein